MHLTEDVINRKIKEGNDISMQSHMMHGDGCWDIDKTYWINFHQTKNTVTELSQIRKIIDFLE